MNPILFDETERDFSTHGLFVVYDSLSCQVTEVLNGSYELEMRYHVSGAFYNELKSNRILLAKPNNIDRFQPFRIYYISKPINGTITVRAAHISYDLNAIPCSVFYADTLNSTLVKIKENSIVWNSFNFYSDFNSDTPFNTTKPQSARACLCAKEESVLSTYGGFLKYDRFDVFLSNMRGTDKGVRISYGKNLTNFTQEENISEVYTGIYPYAFFGDENNTICEVEGKIIRASESTLEKILPVDFTQFFSENELTLSQASLLEVANEWLLQSNINIPKISISVSFVPLSQTEEYKHIKMLENVELGDIISVDFDLLNISAKARCIKTVYDVLNEKYIKIDIGDVVKKLPETLNESANINKKIDEKINKSYANAISAFQSGIKSATDKITGNVGGHLRTIPKEYPEELVIMDTPSIETAQKVWRWNLSGLGFSENGYDGDYRTAITMDGQIVADFITSGKLSTSVLELDRIITDIEAKGITATSLKVYDNSNRLLFNASGNSVTMGGWSADHNSIFNGTDFNSSTVFFCAPGTSTTRQIVDANGNIVANMSGWVLKVRDFFGLNENGETYATKLKVVDGILNNCSIVGGNLLFFANHDDQEYDISINSKGIGLGAEFSSEGLLNSGLSVVNSGMQIARNSGDFATLYSLNEIRFFEYNITSNYTARIMYNYSYNEYEDGMKILANKIILASGYEPMSVQSNRMWIDSSGVHSSKAIDVQSDFRSKNNIEDLSDKYNVLLDKLRPVRYKYNGDELNKFHTGFIAQEVFQAMEECGICSDEFAGHNIDNTGMQSLSYSSFIALIILRLQKLTKEFERLQKGMLYE